MNGVSWKLVITDSYIFDGKRFITAKMIEVSGIYAKYEMSVSHEVNG